MAFQISTAGLLIAIPVDGASILFWKYFWSNREILADKFDHLFSFALNQDVTVEDFLAVVYLHLFFVLPLSVQANEESFSLLSSYVTMLFTRWLRMILDFF